MQKANQYRDWKLAKLERKDTHAILQNKYNTLHSTHVYLVSYATKPAIPPLKFNWKQFTFPWRAAISNCTIYYKLNI